MKKKLRIAILFSSDTSKAGGVQEHVYALGRELLKKGHKIDTFGPSHSKLKYVNYHEVGNVLPVSTPNGNVGSVLIGNEKSKDLPEIINKNYDIFNVQEPYLPWVAWNLIKEVKIPKVATFHSAWEDESIISIINPLIPLLKETFSKNVNGAIYVSEITKRRWRSLCDKNVLQKVINNGIDHSLFYPKEKKEDRVVKLLFVGRLVQRKGLQYLLQAIDKIRLKTKNFKLIVLGGGVEKEKLKEFVRKNKLGRWVEFRGEILGNERIKYFQEADIFCAPYVDEAFAITILEAMACGAAIMGFKIGAFNESLKNYPGKNFLVKYRDVDGLAKSLITMIKNNDLRKKLRDWEIKESKKYSWDKVAETTEDFYYQVLKKKNG